MDPIPQASYDGIPAAAPFYPSCADDLAPGIAHASALDARPVFREGLARRLTQLGVPCGARDTQTMLREVKDRYETALGKACPRTVIEWIRGTPPGVSSRRNHYELCFALGMDARQTAAFFKECYLTMPYNVKCATDAVFLYALQRRRPYAAVEKLLEASGDFVLRDTAGTATSRIAAAILQIEDDEALLAYLSTHCFSNEGQYRMARETVVREADILRDYVKEKDRKAGRPASDRLNSRMIEEMLGYRYQRRGPQPAELRLPKRFSASLPNDVTLGQILNGARASYETLRKTMLLLMFCNYYHAAEDADLALDHEPTAADVRARLLDFIDEVNRTLDACGFSVLYARHPFDYLLLYCADTYDPVLAFQYLLDGNGS